MGISLLEKILTMTNESSAMSLKTVDNCRTNQILLEPQFRSAFMDRRKEVFE